MITYALDEQLIFPRHNVCQRHFMKEGKTLMCCWHRI